ncbi:hypothetical protein HRI_000251900 [Hibiscus trionum]|uniref:Uncharacterized protein n=1 Tax=Hibiscus trionum TaxID=183268 RepID=A0A9W7LIU4_HIBTR|nr:hypothetical protein HRI_000251900 [Hibiscus trionum]
MSEKILIAASMAALVCHPNTSIKCFKPKPKPSSSEGEKTSKSRTSVFSSCSNVDTTLTPHVPSTSCRASCLVSNLCEEDPAFRAVETVFKSGWDGKVGHKIEKILKINHNIGVLKRFEEYRQIVKSKSANIFQRLAVDGNELLRFHGTIVTCSLGNNGLSRICNKKSCGVCRMIGLVGSTGKESVALSNDSRRAHWKVTKECSVTDTICTRKAIVVCRVIAGRVARCRGRGFGLVEGREGGFDSVVSLAKDPMEGSEELIALNARAVLPCFVILYNVKHSKYYTVSKSNLS